MKDRKAFLRKMSFGPVTRDRIVKICNNIELQDRVAMNELEISLLHIEADLATYRRLAYLPAERKSIISKRKKLQSALAKLDKVLEDEMDVLLEVLPKKALQEIGLLLARETIEDVLGEHAPDYLRGYDRKSEHEAAGIEYGHLFIRHIVSRILGPIRDWTEENRQNVGGTPPDYRRRFIIRELAKEALGIIGTNPTGSTNSPFVQLCIAVFQEFELPDDGIEDAIERELQHLEAEAASQDDAK